MEWEGLIREGQIKRSTLQEKLSEKGYSTRQMRMYSDAGIASRRYQKRHRNRLWHSDIKYGPYLPVGKDGAPKQVYLVTFIDDATRFVLHGEFYPTLDQVIVEDCFRKAIHKYAVPEAVYFDNGSQYRTKWMQRTCSKLGTRLVFAKPKSPEATGKVERFNRVVDAFLSEAKLEKPQSLDKLNELFGVWLEECYQNKPHSGLGDNTSPHAAFWSDNKALKHLAPETIANAFLLRPGRHHRTDYRIRGTRALESQAVGYWGVDRPASKAAGVSTGTARPNIKTAGRGCKKKSEA
jgi:transposase InsO family protein